jgi:glycosyltransferase involved in cell wall biosynthesis
MRASCAVLLPTPLFGGHETMLLEWLGRAVAQHGLRVQIYSADNERLVRACEAAGLGRPLAVYPARQSAIGDFLATWRLLRRIPAELPILLAPGVLQTPLRHWLAALLLRRRVAGYVPMAYSARRMRFRGGALRDWVAGHIVRRADLWITISARQRQLLTNRWQVSSPVLVVSNRLAILEREPAPPRAPAAGALRVLFAGRFDANQKGLDWLCARLRAHPAEWIGQLRFTFQGEGPFGPQLRRLSADLGRCHIDVRSWGEVDGAMDEADVLLLPSRFEGLPLIALQAAHRGLPVVASGDAGLAELLPPWCLFDFGDEAAMWAALKALRDPARRAQALAHSHGEMRRLLSAAAFRSEVDQVVDALARLPAPAAGKPTLMERGA